MVTLVAPVLLPILADRVLIPVFVPVRVSVCAFVLPKAIAPPLVKLSVPTAPPEASRVAVLPFALPIVNRRSVLAAVKPVYCRVPPPNARFDAALVEAPIELLDPPLARLAAFRIPPLILVTPE